MILCFRNAIGVGPCFDFVLERALRRLGWHVDALSAHVELPAVIHAAEAMLFITAEIEVCAPVWAVRVEDPDDAAGVTKGHEVFA